MFNLYQPTTAATIFVADADARFSLLENNGPFLASFSLFSSFQFTVDIKQMFNV